MFIYNFLNLFFVMKSKKNKENRKMHKILNLYKKRF